MSVNKVILVGRLGQDPELKYTPSGAAVANFTMATSESWVDKSGQKQEKTEWHRVVVWGKLAELCQKYLQKGRQAYLEGRIQTRSWDDQASGQKRYTTEVIAQTVQFLGSSTGMSAETSGAEMGSGARTAGASGFAGTPSGNSAESGFGSSQEPTFTEDDIPF